jgi:hypothetical protein
VLTFDHGIIDATALGWGALAYGILICYVTMVVVIRKKDSEHRRAVEKLATEYIIREADAAIYLLFTRSRTFRQWGEPAWNTWRNNYLMSVQTLCDSRIWIDMTCVGQLPLMDNPAYAVDSATAHEIHLTLGEASLLGRPKLPA